MGKNWMVNTLNWRDSSSLCVHAGITSVVYFHINSCQEHLLSENRILLRYISRSQKQLVVLGGKDSKERR